MKNIKSPLKLLAALLLFSFAACSDDDETIVPPPTSENAAFTYTFDPVNPNKVIFTGQPDVPAWYMHWSFGDNTAAEGVTVEKVYFLAGEYEVRFKIFTENGTAESFQTLTIESDIVGPNLVQNGALDSDESWTVLPITSGVNVTFENGAATWKGGGWGHAGIFQAIQVEANTEYQINMDISGSGMTDCWFEVYMGTVVPTPGVDYTSGGIRLGLNTWDGCGSTPFQGQLTALTCSNGGGDGTFEFSTPETAYLVIRGGGAELGTAGVTVDNISIRPL